MLDLFLNHPPLFVAGEIALSLSLALFVGALIAAVIRGVPRSQLRETGHPDATIVVGLWAKRSTLVRMFRASLWQRGRRFDPACDPRCAKKAPTFEATRS
jgi:hypothetical protein